MSTKCTQPRLVMRFFLLVLLPLAACGCHVFQPPRESVRYYNPFPQFHKVAVLPFYNQSGDPTVNGDEVALAYYNELQQIPGFEVMPVGVARRAVESSGVRLQEPADFQRLARLLEVDAVAVGSVTESSPYYPPRLGLAVNWYAADPRLQPIPPGYGLGDPEEASDRTLFAAQFAAAQAEFSFDSPEVIVNDTKPESDTAPEDTAAEELPPPGGHANAPLVLADPRQSPPSPQIIQGAQPHPPVEPIMTHVRVFNGNDDEVTEELREYYAAHDDDRSGRWRGYLMRSDDFLRFCCHRHIADMLAARGGMRKTELAHWWLPGR